MRKLRALKPAFKELGLKRVRVFGSVVRGEAGPGSDVDLLVEFYETPGLLEFVGVKHDLEDRLGIKVDLTTQKGLHRALKDDILAEAQDV